MDLRELADKALDRLPPEHYAASWYVFLVVAVIGAMAAIRRWVLPPSPTLAELEAAVKRGINGTSERTERLEDKIDRLAERVDDNRKAGDRRHDENLDRLARLERLIWAPWDGRDRRKG